VSNSVAAASGAPVLVIGFNRPERLRAALEAVMASEPRRLYIAIDGPRTASDSEAVAATRAVAEAESRTVEKYLRLRETNLGCRLGVIDAVSWFLSAEPEGIIVEDDSIPDISFFRFAGELLARFRDDQNVLSIAGESRVPSSQTNPEWSYRFSLMGPAGAWATWSDRWFSFIDTRIDLSLWRTASALRASGSASALETAHWTAMMLANRTRVVDSWAYPFMIHGIAKRMLTATPNVNLVDDAGVGGGARHMSSADPLAQEATTLAFPLRHPPFVAVDRHAEAWSDEYEVGATPSGIVRNGAQFGRRFLRRG
jgi:hypothetical protein